MRRDMNPGRCERGLSHCQSQGEMEKSCYRAKRDVGEDCGGCHV